MTDHRCPWNRYAAVISALWLAYSEAVVEGEDEIAKEWADALDVFVRGLPMVGPDAAIVAAATTIQVFIEEADEGIAGDVPERIVDENRQILSIFRIPLDADEREAVDRMVREELEEAKDAPERERRPGS